MNSPANRITKGIEKQNILISALMPNIFCEKHSSFYLAFNKLSLRMHSHRLYSVGTIEWE